MTTKSAVLAQAITRCEAAQAAYDAMPDDDADMKEQLFLDEADAADALAELPCASDAEFIEKLRFLLARETSLFGAPNDGGLEFGSIAIAVDRHLGPATPGKLRLVWPAP
jgi:hypothetical protein